MIFLKILFYFGCIHNFFYYAERLKHLHHKRQH